MSSPPIKKGKKPIKTGIMSQNSGFASQPSNTGKRKRSDNQKYKSTHPPRPAKKKAVYGGERPHGIPGASKLKASIRQTNRLLSKPNLAPGAKIEAERRLASLTADLETLERSRNEKSLASRYHKVKFFERQKLVRGINKIKRSISKLESKQAEAGEKNGDDSEQESDYDDGDDKNTPNTLDQLQEQLRNYRVYLHYVLRFPPDERYVALFPGHVKQPQPPRSSDKDRTRAAAYKVLQNIDKRIKSGELSQDPEVELERGETENRTHKFRAKNKAEGKQQQKQQKSDTEDDHDHDHESESEREERVQGVKGDDFFAQDSDSDSNSNSDSDDDDE